MVTDADIFRVRSCAGDRCGDRQMLRLLHDIFLWEEDDDEKLADLRAMLESYFEEVAKL